MLKLSCNNGTDHIQALSQCKFFAPATSLFARRSSTVVFCSSAAKIPAVSAAVSDRGGFRFDGVANRVEPSSETLADRLRLGSLTENGLSYKEKFIVRSYEVGINKTATVETIANLLQVLT